MEEIYDEFSDDMMEDLRTGKMVIDKGLVYNLNFDDATYSLSCPLWGRVNHLNVLKFRMK